MEEKICPAAGWRSVPPGNENGTPPAGPIQHLIQQIRERKVATTTSQPAEMSVRLLRSEDSTVSAESVAEGRAPSVLPPRVSTQRQHGRRQKMSEEGGRRHHTARPRQAPAASSGIAALRRESLRNGAREGRTPPQSAE